jgi:hypothetical protein
VSKGTKRQLEIAGRLLLLREKLYGNASEMARSVKLTPQRWYNYETGRRALDIDTAAIVVEEHGVDYNWLYGGRSDTLKPKLRKLLGDQHHGKRERKAKRKRARAAKPKPKDEENGLDPHK